MRNELIPRALILLVLAGGAPLGAQEPLPGGDAVEPTGHGELGIAEALPPAADPALRERERALFGRVICACKEENWTRTLTNCREGCADPQKNAIREQLRAGWSDEQILDAQLARYGPLVIGSPGWEGTGKWLYILPAAALVAGLWIAAAAIRRSAQAGRAARRVSEENRSEVPPDELARIERDLERIE